MLEIEHKFRIRMQIYKSFCEWLFINKAYATFLEL